MSNLPKTPSFDLSGRTALVTGAGRGIGLAAAAALAEAGAKVTLAARTAGEITAAAARIGRGAEAMVLDVSDLTSVGDKIAEHGPFDILVNNAGTNRPMPLWDVTEADYDAVLDLNLKSAFFVAQAVAKGLIAAGRPGSLIHMSSDGTGRRPEPQPLLRVEMGHGGAEQSDGAGFGTAWDQVQYDRPDVH
jgi:NAD(P)-dependent dehydrogenase (short-subunit alcohol dehydrogenase family)